MTDKERIEQLLNSINKDFPERIDLGKRLKEVYRIMAMDELELLTLDQYQGQNMDYVLQQLQKEGLELGDKITALDKQIKKKFNVSVIDLQSDLALLNQFDVSNMTDLPSDIRNGMTITPRNEIPQADYYNKVFDEIVEQNPLDEPDVTLNPDGSITEKSPGLTSNTNVPIEEFTGLINYDAEIPKIFDDLKGTTEYSRMKIIKGSVANEIKSKKFAQLILNMYDILGEYAKDLSTEDKKLLVERVNDRTYGLDEKYKDIVVIPDEKLSLEQLNRIDDAIADLNKNFKNELPGLLDEMKLRDLDFVSDANVEDNVVDFREAQLKKLMEEVEEATPDVKKITPTQAEMIDNALADAAANMRRESFEALPGGKGAVTRAIKNRLIGILGDGINLLDVYELALLGGAIGGPALEPLMPLIFPSLKDTPKDDKTYGQKVIENIQAIEKISPTAIATNKVIDALPDEQRDFNMYGVNTKDINQNYTANFSSMYGMLGGNNGK